MKQILGTKLLKKNTLQDKKNFLKQNLKNFVNKTICRKLCGKDYAEILKKV
jgi:hypothetical protein